MLLLSAFLVSLAPTQASSAPASAVPAAAIPVAREPRPGEAVLPALDTFSSPAERTVLEELMLEMTKASTPDMALAAADKALAKVPEPTALRGMVQFFRAAPLAATDRTAAAALAIEESIRLLPGYSGPLIAASGIYTYSNTPGPGADYLLRAAAIDPATVRGIDDYEIDALLRRLRTGGDRRRVQALSERLLAIDWQGRRLGAQSRLASDTIRALLARKDVAGARALVPRLLAPGDSYTLLTLREAEPIWPDIERWAGPMLGKQWVVYLREARARWTASKSADTTLDYAAALSSADHYRSLVRDLLPLFDTPDAETDSDLMFVVTPLAGALARQGRMAEVEKLFARAQKVWPLDGQPNALNIASNRAIFLMHAGRTSDGVKQMDEALQTATRWGSQINADALLSMHWNRACALAMAGRAKEGAASIAIVLGEDRPGRKAQLRLCMDDLAGARRELLTALKDPDTRDAIVGFIQPSEKPIAGSRYSELLHSRREALRSDPELIAAVAAYGRRLPFRVADGAPPETP